MLLFAKRIREQSIEEKIQKLNLHKDFVGILKNAEKPLKSREGSCLERWWW